MVFKFSRNMKFFLLGKQIPYLTFIKEIRINRKLKRIQRKKRCKILYHFNG